MAARRIHVAVDPGSTHSGWVMFKLGPAGQAGLRLLSFGKTPNRKFRSDLAAIPKAQRGMLVTEMLRARGMPTANEELETCVQIGRILQTWGGSNWSYVFRLDVKIGLCGDAKAKDSNIRAALIDLFGGEKQAIGGRKCPECKGKKWIGRDHAPCESCQATPGWLHPPGPLYGMTRDMWAALAIAVHWSGDRKIQQRLSSSLSSCKRKKSRRGKT